MSDRVSVRMSLLDQQLVDRDRRPIGRVDDLELLPLRDGEPPAVTAILTGAQALGERLGGLTGHWMAAASERLRGERGPTRIDVDLVQDLHPMVLLRVALADLPQAVGLERWLARHVIERLPGAGDARE